MNEPKPGKHVIFLGAGASMSSGYPSAKDLRLAMASEAGFSKYIQQHLRHNSNGAAVASEFWNQFNDISEYFRNGGYNSVDEFCYLARGSHPAEVQGLKALMSFALAVVEPEHRFEESDYYPFIQRLFKANSDELRDDICIISFNYDPYLEFLLHRAVQTRARAAKGKWHKCPTDRAILSGFHPGSKDCVDNWPNGDGFAILKLHGTIAICRHDLPPTTSTILTFDDLFSNKPQSVRVTQIANKLKRPNTPVFFPWEILDEGLGFQNGSEHWRGNLPYDEHRDGGLTKLAEQIWNRARAEVQRAAKVSFVGFSAHPFLVPAFRKLFLGKSGGVSIAVSNPDRNIYSRVTANGRTVLHTSSSAQKIVSMIREICPEQQLPFQNLSSSAYMYDITTESFREFLDKEMGPVPSFAPGYD